MLFLFWGHTALRELGQCDFWGYKHMLTDICNLYLNFELFLREISPNLKNGYSKKSWCVGGIYRGNPEKKLMLTCLFER